MKHTLIKTLIFIPMFIGVISIPLSVYAASTVTTDFESASVPVTVHGYEGWSMVNTSIDQGIVANTYGHAKFGTKVLRVSNKATGGFSDQLFSASTADEAGETTAVNGGQSGGTRQTHFEVSFDFASASPVAPAASVGMEVDLDRGDGRRMGLLDLEDYPGGVDGIEVYYNGSSWSGLLALLDRDKVYRFKMVVDFVEGHSNDVVKLYLDDVLIHTTTTWENYYRFGEGQGNATSTIDSVMIKPFDAKPANEGGGFLFDNFVLYSGPAHVPDTEITEEDPELVIEETSAPITITVPVTVASPTLNLSAVQTGLVAETPVAIAVTTQTAKGDVAVSIPSGTTITGSAGWDGIVNLPKVSSTTVTPTVTSKQTATVALVIDVGTAGTLTFDNAVSLTLPGQAGKQVGFSQDGGTTFTEITTLCVADALPGGSNECKVDSGSDLKILTKHFTLFASYSVTTNPSTGSRVIGRVAAAPTPTTTTVTPTVPVVTPTSPTVVVTNPVTTSYKFTTLMKVGTKNADVKELQKLLTQKGFGTLVADGWFGVKTGTALKALQKANGLTSDGVAGPMTRAILNK